MFQILCCLEVMNLVNFLEYKTSSMISVWVEPFPLALHSFDALSLTYLHISSLFCFGRVNINGRGKFTLSAFTYLPNDAIYPPKYDDGLSFQNPPFLYFPRFFKRNVYRKNGRRGSYFKVVYIEHLPFSSL